VICSLLLLLLPHFARTSGYTVTFFLCSLISLTLSSFSFLMIFWAFLMRGFRLPVLFLAFISPFFFSFFGSAFNKRFSFIHGVDGPQLYFLFFLPSCVLLYSAFLSPRLYSAFCVLFGRPFFTFLLTTGSGS